MVYDYTDVLRNELMFCVIQTICSLWMHKALSINRLSLFFQFIETFSYKILLYRLPVSLMARNWRRTNEILLNLSMEVILICIDAVQWIQGKKLLWTNRMSRWLVSVLGGAGRYHLGVLRVSGWPLARSERVASKLGLCRWHL